MPLPPPDPRRRVALPALGPTGGVRVSVVIVTRSRPEEFELAGRLARGVLERGADEAVVQTGSGGVAHARNLGAANARGEVLVFMDNDGQLRGSLAPLRDPPADVGFWVPRALRYRTRGLYGYVGCKFVNFLYRTDLWPFAIGPLTAVRKEAFAALQGFDPEVSFEDLNFGWRLWKGGYAHALLPVEVDVLRPFTPPHLGPKRTTGRGRERPPQATAYRFERGPPGAAAVRTTLHPELEQAAERENLGRLGP